MTEEVPQPGSSGNNKNDVKVAELINALWVGLPVSIILWPIFNTLGSGTLDEVPKALLATAASLAIGWFLAWRTGTWLEGLLVTGWERFARDESGEQMKKYHQAMKNLADVAAALPALSQDLRQDLKSMPERLAAGVELAGTKGLELVRVAESTRHSVGNELPDAFYSDHTQLNGSGSFLLTMSGYLSFLERVLSEEPHNLICLNKTLPVAWFASVSEIVETDDFLPGYISMAMGYADKISRITLVESADELHAQFERALLALPQVGHDSDRDARWLLSILLPVIATESSKAYTKDHRELVERTLRVAPKMEPIVRRLAAQHYKPTTSGGNRTPVSPGAEIDRGLAGVNGAAAAISTYVRELRGNKEELRAWSDCVNIAFAALMGSKGVYWGVRERIGRLVEDKDLQALISRHSEVGVFTMTDRKLAFHARGDLFAGVVIKTLGNPESIERSLAGLIRKIDSGEIAEVLGKFGG